jgi:hypothetical protein
MEFGIWERFKKPMILLAFVDSPNDNRGNRIYFFMTRKFLLLTSLLTIAIMVSQAIAQRNVTPAVDRDPLLEADAKHNLDVARQYFTLKKAYKGVVTRFEETFAAYPEFSKMDEFLYLAGMSSWYLSENKGKQGRSRQRKGKGQICPGQAKRGRRCVSLDGHRKISGQQISG